MTSDRRDYLRLYQKGWIRKKREDWLKANGPCRQCGSGERLEVDHIDPAQKVSHTVWSWKPERREEELKKCQVLCRVCHRKKTSEDLRRIKTGRPGHPHKLNESLVLEIFKSAKAGMGPRAIGKQFCISHTTVIDIRDGKIWRWLTQGAA